MSGTMAPTPLRHVEHLSHTEGLIREWLDGQYSESCETKLLSLLDAILSASSPIRLYQVMRMLPQIFALTESRFSMPLLNWPWLDTSSIDLERHSHIYSILADVLQRTSGYTTYAYGNGPRLYAYSGSKQLYCIRSISASPGDVPTNHEFQKWYSDCGNGKGITLSLLKSEPSPGKFRRCRPEVAILCALAKDRNELHHLVISILISMAFVQAVSLGQGSSVSKCDSIVQSTYAYTTTDQIGGQITILAAVCSRLSSPREYTTMTRLEASRYANVPYGKLSVATGIAPVSNVALSNNMYWLEQLGETKSEPAKSGNYSVFGVEDALFVRDVRRPLRWFGTALPVIAVSLISVVFQEVCWAEKLEKFLNLLFTATVATVIGLASAHPEENLVANLTRGRRRIANADAGGQELFADIIAYPERIEYEEEKEINPGRFVDGQQSSWVSDWNHGTTTLGRPVRLNEPRTRKLTVSSSYELCVKTETSRRTRDSLRHLFLSLDGVGKVGQRTTATDCSGILLNSTLRLA